MKTATYTAVFVSVAAAKRGLGAAFWRWPHFKPEEIACKDGSIMVNSDALDALERLRDHIGKPFVIHSAYRSAAYNANVGGAPRSMHLLARAFDIDMRGHDPHEFEAAARAHGFNGIGRYPKQNFLHIDTRETPAVWGEAFPFGEDDHLAPPAPALPGKPAAKVPALPTLAEVAAKAARAQTIPPVPPRPVAQPRGLSGFWRRYF